MTKYEKHQIFDLLLGQMQEIKFTHKMLSKTEGENNEYLPIAFERISTLRMIGIDFFVLGFIEKEDAQTLLDEYVSFFEKVKEIGNFTDEKYIKFIEGIIDDNRRTLEGKDSD